MHPRNPHLYFFSPTGGTQRVAGLFAENLNAADACTDITVHAEAKTFSADDCLLVFFPVYGGRVPGPCLARMRALRGTDTPAVLVAVFGNRAVDDALLEMRDTLTPLGFRVIAAAEVIAPHSVNTDIAAGRPDYLYLASDADLIQIDLILNNNLCVFQQFLKVYDSCLDVSLFIFCCIILSVLRQVALLSRLFDLLCDLLAFIYFQIMKFIFILFQSCVS